MSGHLAILIRSPMTFLWNDMLWLLAGVPLLVALYIDCLRRRSRAAVRYADTALIKAAIGPAQRIRRHLPPALFLAAMIAIAIAIARPHAMITLPANQQTLILAIDVSLSMRATDVDPTRLTAAQIAAKAFIEDLPRDLRIGLVSFGGTAALVQTPTTNHEDLIAAIDRFQLQRGTATGSALVVALAALFPDAGIDVESFIWSSTSSRFGVPSAPVERKKTEPKPFTAVAPGSYSSGAIILLSDGRRTTGPDPLEAAKMAADRGVRVYTVGFGTVEGSLIGFGSWSAYVRLDEETLKAVANITRAEYYHAGTAADLKKVYQTLNSKIVLERKETELTALFAAAAALLAVLAALLSLLWFNRAAA